MFNFDYKEDLMKVAVDREKIFDLMQFSTRRDDPNESGFGADDLGLIVDDKTELKDGSPRDSDKEDEDDLGAKVFSNDNSPEIKKINPHDVENPVVASASSFESDSDVASKDYGEHKDLGEH